MNDRQRRILDSHEKVLAYLRDQGTPIAREAPAILDRLERTVADIDRYRQKQYMARQACHVMSARNQLEEMRKVQMLPLARLARRVFAGEPGIEAALRVPHKRAPARLNWKRARHVGKRLGRPPAPRKRAP